MHTRGYQVNIVLKTPFNKLNIFFFCLYSKCMLNITYLSQKEKSMTTKNLPFVVVSQVFMVCFTPQESIDSNLRIKKIKKKCCFDF